MAKGVQISAFVSEETKDLLDELVRATGLKKGYVVEMALRHQVQALQELPLDIIVSPKIVISRRSGEELVRRLRSRPRPTKALRDLMKRRGH
jgi:predicted DNA-binding protein